MIHRGYDRASNRTYRRDEVARSQTPLKKFDELYGYDGLNRLEDFDRGKLNTGNTAITGATIGQDWTLDQTGNWNNFNQTVQDALTQTRTHNKVNEITAIAETVGDQWKDPAHDANGNMTTIPQPKDLTKGYTATWDAWNRLVKLTNDADGDKTVAEFEYDGNNRRTIKKSYTGGSLDETRHFYYSDAWQVLEERVDSATAADKQYVWGMRYVDDLVLRDKGSDRLYALQDALFNVVALTDDTGSVKERFAYQPYGESEELNPDFTTYTGNDYNWEYRFTGRELDIETGLQLNRNRFYHARLGRWVSRDPILYRGGMNLYGYVGGRPTYYVDPSGLFFFCTGICGGVTGTATGLFGPVNPICGIGYSGGFYRCYGYSPKLGWVWGVNCATVSFTFYFGTIGGWLGLSGGPSLIINVFPEATLPSQGFSVSVGVSGGVACNGFAFPEMSLDIDTFSGDTTFSLPKFGPAFGVYASGRLTGTCTACGPNFGVIKSKIKACILRTIQTGINAIKAGLPVPNNTYDGDIPIEDAPNETM